jgi:hypothetical protein
MQTTRFLDMTKMYILEQCVYMTFAFLTYTLPEALTLSGIMSLLFFGQVRIRISWFVVFVFLMLTTVSCAKVTAHYAFYNLSVESKVASRQMIKVCLSLTVVWIFLF